ncbi:potassium transporter Kup [Methylomonas rapida]|jgi:K+ transporter|uniref:Probable potassium transport system protein Kup n=1 Tax=Methylomonas rapida TaxID=2963939 RepID=A0ABY7GKL4_9GAMM|nr:potassium transporter Kup [Methylomonas rapida]WAR45029.1 potassium transporter Kup [Methylomonas rapida]
MALNHPIQSKQPLSTLAFGAIGVVFADIGTSPLYAVKEIFHGGVANDATHILGVLSLIFWALTLVVATKYTVFIMRADNKGEGGIIALMALALQGSRDHPERKQLVITLGLLGAALFYGDSIITPAISVVSALEGIKVASPRFENLVIPLTLILLIAMFVLQTKGSRQINKFFPHVMCVWFATLGLLGLINIAKHPDVLNAVNPYYAFNLLAELGWKGFVIMGGVVLAITGAETLYADMGNFGLKAIRLAWFGFVFPTLLLNYFGQGALLIHAPETLSNPFYLLAPSWAMYPMLLLATLATLITSQAVISGAFTVTRQAIQLGYCPRMEIRHTANAEAGRVFVPVINWSLMAAVLILVVSFRNSSALASAYGIAVTGTMIVDTILAFIVIKALWQWNKFTSIAFLSVFLFIDLMFLLSNSLKIPNGGWLSLVVAAALFAVMTTWIKGKEMLAKYLDEKRILFEDLQEQLKDRPLAQVPGTAIYMARSLHGVPQVLLHNLEHNHVMHEKIIVLTIVTKEEPYVDEAHRVKIRSFGDTGNFFRVKLYFGFQEEQDVRRALQLCCHEGLDINPKTVSFFIGSERLSFRRNNPMPGWQRSLFRFLTHNSASAIAFFRIPVERVIELGIRVEL